MARPTAQMSVRALTGLADGQVISESLGRGVGSFRAVGQVGRRVAFCFRCTRSNGKRDDLPVGFWSERGGDGGATLFEARQRVRVLATRYAAGERDLRLALELERREAQRQFDETERARLEEVRRSGATHGALLQAYMLSLHDDGKASARAVQNTLRINVQRQFPTLWGLPLDDISRNDLVTIVHRLVAAGKPVEARKVRSYLRAAFSAEVAASGDPNATAALRDLRIESNPARELMPVKGGSRAR
jgi:hypothetical protein